MKGRKTVWLVGMMGAEKSVLGRSPALAFGLRCVDTEVRLAAAGIVVCLRARSETMLARVGDARGRPLLAKLDEGAREACLDELITARSAANETAAIVVDTDDLDADEVVDRVAQGLADAALQIGASGGR